MDLFIFIFAAVFSVLNPLGAIPVFVGLTQEDSMAERSRISIWAATNVFIILTISFFIGEYLLKFFGISMDALRIAGGLIIVNSGYSLLSGNFPKRRGVNKKVADDAQKRNDIALTPLAMPLLAGPGSMSLLIAFYQDYPALTDKIIVIAAVLTVCILIFLILRSSHYLSKLLGASGIVSISRIMGFIVIALGIQYISVGALNMLQTVFTK
ncbi:NAAT family transporter [Flavobacterium agricola]|uniref:UPF0056 membrane protein n=1 Tax=Flavobacterium agricola TaxID=2870839 RepID=A0ABY6M083_9FLAO|nr:MarC family protein [Flavobacterium agricola]UYW00531.1 NAAT family transporter [Flavobacterium agricola]